jgi:hypothetical protein
MLLHVNPMLQWQRYLKNLRLQDFTNRGTSRRRKEMQVRRCQELYAFEKTKHDINARSHLLDFQRRWHRERYDLDTSRHNTDLQSSWDHLPELSHHTQERQSTPHSNENPLSNNPKQSRSTKTIPRDNLESLAGCVVGSTMSVPLIGFAHRRTPNAGAKDAEPRIHFGGLLEMRIEGCRQ